MLPNRSIPLSLRVLFPIVLLTSLAAVLGACGDSPTDVHSSPPSLNMFCLPAGTQVSCTASFFSGGTSGRQADVTADTDWLVADPAIGVFVRPGIFSPSRRGEAVISARYRGVETRYQFRFLVDPVTTARFLEALSGQISDDLTGAPIAGATVEILSGYAQGARATTNEGGFYLVPTLLAGETFTARATSPGYAEATASYRVDPSVVLPGDPNNPNFLTFRLRRLE
jgi:hypothetical protein